MMFPIPRDKKYEMFRKSGKKRRSDASTGLLNERHCYQMTMGATRSWFEQGVAQQVRPQLEH